MENKIKHLEMIENIIQRMSNNSFQLKGWTVTLITIIGTLSAQGSDKRFFVLALIPLLAFWALDAFYLQLERKYKALYKNVILMDNNLIDFDMNTKDIEVDTTEKSSLSYFNCLISISEAGFYGAISVAILMLIIILDLF